MEDPLSYYTTKQHVVIIQEPHYLKPPETAEFGTQTDFDDFPTNSSTLNIFYCSTYYDQEVGTYCNLVKQDDTSPSISISVNEETHPYAAKPDRKLRPRSKHGVYFEDESFDIDEALSRSLSIVKTEPLVDEPYLEEQVLERKFQKKFYLKHEENSEDDDDDSSSEKENSLLRGKKGRKKCKRFGKLKGKKVYQCRLCDTSVATGKELIDHVLENHKKLNVSLKCNKCSESFTLAYELQRHKETVHDEMSNISCGYCNKTFDTTDLYIQHLKTNHYKKKMPGEKSPDKSKPPKGPYICDICNKTFRTFSLMYNHKRTHTRPFKCDQCPKSFPFMSILKIHQSTHSDEKPFPCNLCDSKFRNRVTLNFHKKRSHFPYKYKDSKNPNADLPFKCESCPRAFRFLSTYKFHISSHSDERPYPCDICPKKFRNSVSLNNHKKKVHFPDRKHKCPTCTKSFTDKTKLTIHMRTHTGEKPFICNTCGSRFTLNGNLQIHIRSVHGVYVQSVSEDGTAEVKLVKYKRPPRKSAMPGNVKPPPQQQEYHDSVINTYFTNPGVPSMTTVTHVRPDNENFMNIQYYM